MTKRSRKIFIKYFVKILKVKMEMWGTKILYRWKLSTFVGDTNDETASVIYGVYEHYKITKEEKFIKDTFKMCDKAVRFLERYMDNIWVLRTKVI